MKEITDPRWIKIKGILFLIVGLLASALLLLENPRLKVALLLSITAWCFCRFYYFAFYVIEHYVDPAGAFRGCGPSRDTCGPAARTAGETNYPWIGSARFPAISHSSAFLIPPSGFWPGTSGFWRGCRVQKRRVFGVKSVHALRADRM